LDLAGSRAGAGGTRRVVEAPVERFKRDRLLEAIPVSLALNACEFQHQLDRHVTLPLQDPEQEYRTRNTTWRSASSLRRERQVRHQTHRNTQFVELEVRPQERHGPVNARLAGHFRDLDPGLTQRPLRLDALLRVVVRHYVVRDPVVEERLDLALRLIAADLVAHHRLEVV